MTEDTFPLLHSDETFDALIDTLLPGMTSWPSGARAIASPCTVVDTLPSDTKARVITWAKEIGAAPAPDRAAIMAAYEREAPEAFTQMLRAFYSAYYASAATQERIRVLAQRGPRESSPYVDATLVTTVVSHHRGARRL